MQLAQATRQTVRIPLATSIAALVLCTTSFAQRASFEREPIDYLNTPVHDPVANLAEKIDAGRLQLDFDSQRGYLPAVLKALEVPVSSQVLVFSKTSMQLHHISPRRPRAVYFSDDVYVGWCQGGEVLELAATDPQQGASFYTIKQTADQSPRIVRDRGHCLSCHATGRTQNVPGYLVRSVFAARSGQPNLSSGTFTSDHSSPFSERWGGWYVTGTHGRMRHMGNVYFDENDEQGDREAGANRKSLDEFFSTAPYLSPHSDLVALMILEHQTQMHNAIASANYEAREALHQMQQMNELLQREPGYLSESAQRRLDKAAQRVVSHLLMCDEFPLTDQVCGTSEFAAEFAARGRRDARGRSLRDLDLSNRLFRYPCSYLIHSPAFDQLPEQVRDRVVKLLRDVLQGNNDSAAFQHLTSAIRSDILEILHDTKPQLFDQEGA